MSLYYILYISLRYEDILHAIPSPPKAYLGIKSERHYEPTRYVLVPGLSRSIPYPHLTRGQQDLRDDGPDPSNWPDRIDPF